MLSALFAAFHYLALGIGLGSVFMRGRYLRALAKAPASRDLLPKLFAADSLWGAAALLWIVTGVGRAFGGLEKSTDWYLHHSMFILKMAIFGLVFALEIYPISTLIRWRIRLKKGGLALEQSRISRMRVLNDLEVVLVCLIPMVASLMARGIGY